MTARTPAPGSRCPRCTLADVRERLSALYHAHEAEEFLYSTQPLLDHRRPMDLISEGKGDEVIHLLDQLDSGVYL